MYFPPLPVSVDVHSSLRRSSGVFHKDINHSHGGTAMHLAEFTSIFHIDIPATIGSLGSFLCHHPPPFVQYYTYIYIEE